MDKDEVIAAVKKVRARKSQSNYMLVELAYDRKYILPYADGLKLMESLQNAEQLMTEYATRVTTIQSISEKVEFSAFPAAEYVRIKTAAILGVDAKEIPLTLFEE